jgi:valyl-tRNA synthetase
MSLEDIELSNLNNVDNWILDKLNKTISSVNRNMEKYEFAQVGNELYNFIWNDYCNWYIEFSKSSLNSEDEKVVKATKSTLLLVLIDILKLLHPFMPFVTERIYLSLPHKCESICIAQWPKVREISLPNTEEVETIISIVTAVRTLRVDYDVKPSLEFDITIYDGRDRLVLVDKEIANMLYKLCKVNWTNSEGNDLVVRPLENGKLAVDTSQIIDYEAEKERLEKEKTRLENEINRSNKMLSNKNFILKASKEKVQKEKDKLVSYTSQYEIIVKQLEEVYTKI